jgi:hypothetical protein
MEFAGNVGRIRAICGVGIRALGVLLIVAAMLKGIELSTRSRAMDLWEAAEKAFVLVQVIFELMLGAWLVSGYQRRYAVRVGLLVFLVFFAVTIYQIIIGAKSCGCFGAVHVPPTATLLAVDLPAILILLLFGVLPESEGLADVEGEKDARTEAGN